jgi:predicted branched-subunit amino acid permease
LHLEDWLAVLASNHLFAGADAFVAAQLWDVPVSLSAIPRPNGAVFVATLRW